MEAFMDDRRKMEDALVLYISVLRHSATITRQAQDRSAYSDHLAKAALLFEAIHKQDGADISRLLEDEGKSFGRSFLSGEEGKTAEMAFSRFADEIQAIQSVKA
jgi:hypothetical protein